MSNFEKIVLDKLTTIESDIKELKSDMKKAKADISRIESKIDKIEITTSGIQERTMELCESTGITEQSIKSMKELIIDNEIEIKTLKRKIG